MNKQQKAQIATATANIQRIGEIARTWRTRRNNPDMAKSIRIGKRFIRIYKGS